MSTSTLPVSKLISVSITLTSSAAQGADLNSCMIIGDSNVIDTQARYRKYTGSTALTTIASDFGNTAPEYLAADVFLSQSPQPQTLYIGRWAKTATEGRLYGAPLTAAQQLLSTWTVITTGAFLATVDGVPYNVTGLSFSSALNLNGVASTVQIALAALSGITAGVGCTWNSAYNRFEFNSGSTGVNSSFGYLKTSTAVGSAAFSGQPTAADTLTIAGTAITFVSTTPTGNQVQIGASLTATLTSLAALINGSVDVNLVKVSASVSGSSLYLVSKATGTAGNTYTLAKISTVITVSAATMAGGSAGTDISTTLGGTSSTTSGVYAVAGIAAESALSGLQAIEGVYSNWFGVGFAAGANNVDITDADHVAIAAYIEGLGGVHLYGLTTMEGSAVTANDSTSIGALLKASGYNWSFCQYSSTNPYAAFSLFGMGCSVNFDGSNTTITFAWKSEPGITAENLNSTQSSALDANYYNYYAAFANGKSITVNGNVASGLFIDEVWNAAWFRNRIQTDVFNLMYTTTTKIPQTDAGNHLIATTIESSCIAAVNNGYLAPGTWNTSGFGQLSEGDFLDKGYYIYQPAISSQSTSDRAARKSVSFQVAAKEAGAVHSVQISVVVNQ